MHILESADYKLIKLIIRSGFDIENKKSAHLILSYINKNITL